MGNNDVDLIEIIRQCLREVADEEGFDIPTIAPDTVLFGEEGVLDSAGLVSLVVAVEEQIDRHKGVAISLADERAMSQKRSPFQSIASLAEYARLRIDEEEGDG
jgi:acyl carrier protein